MKHLQYQLALAENAIQIAQNHKQHYDSKLKEHEKKISDLRTKCEEDNAELEVAIVLLFLYNTKFICKVGPYFSYLLLFTVSYMFWPILG